LEIIKTVLLRAVNGEVVLIEVVSRERVMVELKMEIEWRDEEPEIRIWEGWKELSGRHSIV
jgi:hypothetical protein